jgi:mRNA interferase MazF
LEKFVRGDVVVVPFPFSDLTEAKRRPALVLAELDGADRILCQITSQQFRDRYAIPINESDFEEGSLQKISNIRPNRIFTADCKIILYKAGHLKSDKIDAVLKKIIDILAC